MKIHIVSDLSIESKDRSIIGEAGFIKFDNSSEIRSIGVSGKRRFKRCRIEFKDYRQGNVTIYACVKNNSKERIN